VSPARAKKVALTREGTDGIRLPHLFGGQNDKWLSFIPLRRVGCGVGGGPHHGGAAERGMDHDGAG